MKSYSYQYETSPRKIKPDYSIKNNSQKNTRNKNAQKTQIKKKELKKNQTQNKNKNKTKKEQKTTKKVNSGSNIKTKISIFIKCFFIFVFFFLIIYRNSLMTQSFAQIQSLKASIAELQKENNQLEINIQNSLNTNNIEQAAKELLGMQKLTNKQIVYISLLKKDYVEPRTEEVVIENQPNFIEKIIEQIKSIF